MSSDSYKGGKSKGKKGEKIHDEIWELRSKKLLGTYEWIVVGRMKTPRYAHALSAIMVSNDVRKDCGLKPIITTTTTTTTPNTPTNDTKPSRAATALRGNVWILAALAIIYCREFFN